MSLGLLETVVAVIAKHDGEAAERLLRHNASIGLSHQTIDSLNTYWRNQLSHVTDISTVKARECLCQSQDFGAWLRNFEKFVMPIVINYKLPRV